MKKTVIIAVFMTFCLTVSAQKKDWGYVSASLESTSHLYSEDGVNDFNPAALVQLKDGGIFATNNYLKVDYYKGKLSAGTQIEGMFPSIVGYPIPVNNVTLSNFYVGWRDDAFSVTAGTYYEQLGSGLLFRSWEDRTLGLNNAMVGVRGTYNLGDALAVRAFWGIPRMGKLPDSYASKAGETFFGIGLADVNVAAADISVSLSEILDMEDVTIDVEGSVMNRHEALSDMILDLGCSTNTLGWSGRLNMDYEGLYFRGEYVDAGNQLINIFCNAERGNAQLLEFGYNKRGLGLSFTGRRMERMNQKIVIDPAGDLGYLSPANVLSYRPAMSTQYTYMLTTLNPYNPEIGTNIMKAGEIGGQIDAFYNFRRGTALGGKRGMKVHANFSTYYSLNEKGGTKGGERLFTDFSFDVEKQWSKKFKTNFLYSMQDYNKEELDWSHSQVYIGKSHIFVADLLYKWTSRFSTRTELQYLMSDDYQGDWMAALLEVSLAPHWSVFASDMYNHGASGIHYYNGGVSFALGKLRFAAGYGRYRAGFICSGGVCREIPAYTGANFSLTASF